MNNVFKLLLAAVCVAAPLLGTAPAEAGGHRARVRVGTIHRGWTAHRGGYGCLTNCGGYGERFNDCGPVRRGRIIYRIEQNNWYVAPRYGTGQPIGDVYGDEQVFGGKYSSVPGGKVIGGKTGRQIDIDTSQDEQGGTDIFDSSQDSDDLLTDYQDVDDSYDSDDNIYYGTSDDYDQNYNDSDDYDQNYGDSDDYDQYYGDSDDMNQHEDDSYGYRRNYGNFDEYGRSYRRSDDYDQN